MSIKLLIENLSFNDKKPLSENTYFEKVKEYANDSANSINELLKYSKLSY